jgi:exopolysaccharide biosynthesis polyprenyl glycosylphosphotransferase
MSKQGLFHFELSERKVLLRFFDLLVIAFCVVGLNYYFNKTYIHFSSYFPLWLGCYLAYFLFFGTVFELYVLTIAESRFTTFKNLILTLVTTTVLYLLTPYITPELPSNRIVVLHLFISNAVLLTLWRFSYISFITAPRFYKRVLIVGDDFVVDDIINDINAYDQNFQVIGFIDTSGNCTSNKNVESYAINDLETVIISKNIGEIIVADSYKGVSEELFKVLAPQLKKGIPIKPYSKVYEEITKKILLKDISSNFYFYFPFSRSNQNKLYLSLNRSIDILVSFIGILFMLVLVPFIILINLYLNKGNLFYKQDRVGKFNKAFTIIKFRTMVEEAEKDGVKWAKKMDLRITPFGKILRKTRIDELPQFLNILKGEMSLIGPRPERPEFIESLKESIPFYETRHIIKPGLTGWAQVNAMYASSIHETYEKLQYDLYYIKERSLYLDFRIIVKTISTIIFFRGH